MDAKTPKRKRRDRLFPYKAEDLEPRNTAQEIAAEDEYIERNREALNEALEEGYDDIGAGRIRAMDEVIKGLGKRRRAPRRRS